MNCTCGAVLKIKCVFDSIGQGQENHQLYAICTNPTCGICTSAPITADTFNRFQAMGSSALEELISFLNAYPTEIIERALQEIGKEYCR